MEKKPVIWTTGLYNNFYKEESKIKRGKKNDNILNDNGSFIKIGNQNEDGFTMFKRKQLNSFGNLCFMNSSIQCLAHLVNFRKKIINFENPSNLIRETQNLFRDMKNGKKYSNVSGIKNVLSEINDRYKENNQEDANEFISTFLDTILEDTKISLDEMPKIDINKDDIIETKAYDKIFRRFYKKKGGSFIVPLFYGLLKEEKICPKCNTKISVNFNTYNILEIPINEFKDKRRVNLKDIIDSFYGKEIEFIENESCSKCGEIEKVKIITTICTLPKYLIIHFRRTVNNRYIDLDIDYEDKIDFSQKMPKFSTDSNLKNQYSLKGVIEHSGNNKYGHYMAICFNNNTQSWNTFSDTNIICNTNYKSKIAIILLYELNNY
jgi:ubiquitin C-terminal hydrolase